MQKTLFDKIWDSHLVKDIDQNENADYLSGPSLIYIDRHLIHEVTSPQAFASLKQSGRKDTWPHFKIPANDLNFLPKNTTPPTPPEGTKTQP